MNSRNSLETLLSALHSVTIKLNSLQEDGVEDWMISMLGLPTKAIPGTEEKIQVLEERVENRQILFHPLDYRLYDTGWNAMIWQDDY